MDDLQEPLTEFADEVRRKNPLRRCTSFCLLVHAMMGDPTWLSRTLVFSVFDVIDEVGKEQVAILGGNGGGAAVGVLDLVCIIFGLNSDTSTKKINSGRA